jgi:hypothetical protein
MRSPQLDNVLLDKEAWNLHDSQNKLQSSRLDDYGYRS